ncbi:MAG: hypothetical protein AB1736_05355 [Chloroflexota bacterium]
MATLRAALAPLTRAIVLASLTGALIVGTTFAGKPGGSGTTSSFRVDDGRFAATTTAYRGSGTWVHAKCFQNGTVVYEQFVKYGTSGTATLTLGPTPMWQSGSATCVGEDGWWQHGTRWRVTATDAFSASA